MTNHLFQLADGRTLGYSFYGPGDGQPVFYFHGTPSSRLEPLLLDGYDKDLEELLIKYAINLIAIDRPGMGLSTINKKGTFLSFAEDVQQLAKHLNITSAKVLGWSGAGPFALAIAYKYPAIINSVFILTGFTRSFGEPGVFKNMSGNKYYFGAARTIPWLLRSVLSIVSKQKAKSPIPQWISGLPDVDHNLIKLPKQLKAVADNTLKEACINGSNGVVYEAATYYNDFQFTLKDVTQPVHYWYGLKDTTVTKIHPQSLEQQLPNSVLHYKQDEGHLSTYINYFEEVLRTIAET